MTKDSTQRCRSCKGCSIEATRRNTSTTRRAFAEGLPSSGCPRVSFVFSSLCVLCVSAFHASSFGQDWPQWRGPNRDGVAVGAKLPDKWPTGELTPLWGAPLGDGYSSPVIVGSRLYVHDREGEHEYVKCLDAEAGKSIWKHGYAAPYKMHDAARSHGPGPKATTTVVDGRVYAFGISSILTCLDAANGNRIWQRDLKVDYDAEPAEYGTAGSPLVDGDLVIVPVGGKKGGSVMALARNDGRFVWKAVANEKPSFASPIAAELDGIRHVVTFTQNHFVGLDTRTGNVLWKYPFKTSYDQNTVTPVVVGDLVIASGLQKFAFALKVEKSASGVKMTEAWKNRDLRIYMSSPVVVGNHVYGLGGQGALVCVNIATGKTAWSGGDFGEYCSIVVSDNRLLVLDTDGQLTVVKADPSRYEELGQSKVSPGQTWSHLALVGSRIFVRDRERLACFDLVNTASQ